MMFGRSEKEFSSFSEYIGKKSKVMKRKNRVFLSKIDHAIRGEHQHYFSKQDVMTHNENARCKVCKMLLSEFRVQKKMETWTPHLKPQHTTAIETEE